MRSVLTARERRKGGCHVGVEEEYLILGIRLLR